MAFVTEIKAEKRWCPFARCPSLYGEAAQNRTEKMIGHGHVSEPHRLSMCLGSRCMAWRWEDVREYESRVTHGQQAGYNAEGKVMPMVPGSKPEGEGWELDPAYGHNHHEGSHRRYWRRPWTRETRRGFCGLAEPRIAEVSTS